MPNRSTTQPDDNKTLICTKCKEQQPYECFGKMKRSSVNWKTYGGYSMPCKKCNQKRCAARGITEQDKIRAKAYRSTEEYKEMVRIKKKVKYWENPELERAKLKIRYANLPEEKKDAFLAKCRERYSDPEVKARATEQWRARGSIPKVAEARRNHHRKRKAVLRGAAATLTNDQWLSILNFYGNRCAYCKSTDKITMDHVVPVAKGGQHCQENVIPACLSCNCRKQDLDLDTFLSRHNLDRGSFLIKRLSGLAQLVC